MKMNGPEEYRIPNTMPMIHEPVIPRALTDTEYKAVLLDMLSQAHMLYGETDPAYGYTIPQIEEMVLAGGFQLPIIRRIESDNG